jgi:hypothetical protein
MPAHNVTEFMPGINRRYETSDVKSEKGIRI